MILSQYGISVDLPSGWEGRIFMPPPPDDGGRVSPRLHAGNFSIWANRSDFAQGLVQDMDQDGALIAVVEYGPDLVNTLRFSPGVLLPVFLSDLSYGTFPGTHPPHVAAHQQFVTVSNRALCLYVAMSMEGETIARLSELNSVVVTISVVPSSPGGRTGS